MSVCQERVTSVCISVTAYEYMVLMPIFLEVDVWMVAWWAQG